VTETREQTLRIGTVDVPARVDRERYFRELTYVELSVLFAGPQKPGTLAKWAEAAKPNTIGLAAPFSFTHRKPPSAPKLWPHDATTGDFRSSATAREALGPLREAVTALSACCVVFRSPATFSASAANRDRHGARLGPRRTVGAARGGQARERARCHLRDRSARSRARRDRRSLLRSRSQLAVCSDRERRSRWIDPERAARGPRSSARELRGPPAHGRVRLARTLARRTKLRETSRC
jgi:hypothetical protein